MSTKKPSTPRRKALLVELGTAGRGFSDAAVMFHTAVGERLGLGASDWKTLGLLEAHGPLTAGELVSRSGLAPASITGILDRLERRGFLRRSRDPHDGRRVIVELDRGALTEVGTSMDGLVRRLSDLYASYTDDQLETILHFLSEAAARQREATEELSRDCR